MAMTLRITQRLIVTSKTIAMFCQSPYENAYVGLIDRAEKMAARRWVDRYDLLNIVKSLPPHVYDLLPKGTHLIVRGHPGGEHAIEVPPLPMLKGVIAASKWDSMGGTAATTPDYDAVFLDHHEANQLRSEAEVLRTKGVKFRDAIIEFLDSTDLSTPEQFCWSCQPLVTLMNNIEGKTKKERQRYYRSRRYDGMEILLDTVRDRRYLSRDKMRRPRKVATFPDHLVTLCGEAQIILSSSTS